jgi:hypothetical protein
VVPLLAVPSTWFGAVTVVIVVSGPPLVAARFTL